MTIMAEQTNNAVVSGVDTHKDLHVAAVVDTQDRVIGTRSFATTRQGYRQMLAWMRSFGDLPEAGNPPKVVRKVLRPYPRICGRREELDRLLSAIAAKPQREHLMLIQNFEELRGRG